MLVQITEDCTGGANLRLGTSVPFPVTARHRVFLGPKCSYRAFERGRRKEWETFRVLRNPLSKRMVLVALPGPNVYRFKRPAKISLGDQLHIGFQKASRRRHAH